jgi:hypothetical protein
LIWSAGAFASRESCNGPSFSRCFIFGDVTVGRGARANLGEKQNEEDQGRRVQGASRQFELPGHNLLSHPNKKKNRRTGLEDECRPLFHCAKRKDCENQNTAQADDWTSFASLTVSL